ncbi:MAG: LptF/LptG family permease [Phycisphaerales bacterium]|nr:LptF/LptG family permease [Phycisphaerales bacterium]
MTTLDRYIARQYIFNVLALLILLFSFVVAVDVSLNLDRFIEAAREMPQASEEQAGSLRRGLIAVFLIADLWWPRLLQLFSYLIGLVLVGAMGFTFAQLVRHRELVAVLAGGISLHRVARPVLIVASIALGLAVLNQELLIPRLAERGLLTRDHGDAGRRDWSAFEVSLTRDADGRILHARKFDPDAQTLDGINIWERDDTLRATRRITASHATWEDGAWRLENPLIESLQLGRAGIAGGRASIPPTAGPDILRTDLDPTTLLVRRYADFSQNLSSGQINSILAAPHIDPALRDQMNRVRFGRLSTVLSSMLALIIAMPFFLMREPRNMVVQSLKCAPVAMGALMGGILGAAAPIPGLPASFAVFLPVLMLIPIATATTAALRT